MAIPLQVAPPYPAYYDESTRRFVPYTAEPLPGSSPCLGSSMRATTEAAPAHIDTARRLWAKRHVVYGARERRAYVEARLSPTGKDCACGGHIPAADIRRNYVRCRRCADARRRAWRRANR